MKQNFWSTFLSKFVGNRDKNVWIQHPFSVFIEVPLSHTSFDNFNAWGKCNCEPYRPLFTPQTKNFYQLIEFCSSHVVDLCIVNKLVVNIYVMDWLKSCETNHLSYKFQAKNMLPTMLVFLKFTNSY